MDVSKLFLYGSIGLLCSACQPEKKQDGQKPNVLFIMVDDLRPELGCYGNDSVVSPHMDRIADSGLLFERAYCQYPVCGPSRCSLLTGLYATKSLFASNGSIVDDEVPHILTLPECFRRNGYYTVSDGKIFHDHGNLIDGLDSWSEIPWETNPAFWVWAEDENRQYTLKGYKHIEECRVNTGPSWEAADVSDDAYPTGLLTDKAISDIQRLKNMDQPFFLAVGYRKPHLPVNAPKKYWDLYDRSQFKLADNFDQWFNLPEEVDTDSSELRPYGDIPQDGKIDKETWLTLLQGYYACVSYTDAQIGRLLDELESQGLSDNTIVVVLGDHGYQLTEHGLWSKHNTMHVSLHSPLVISVPGKTSGTKTKALVEFIDIYPTLAELAGLPLPEHVQGQSLVPLFENPETEWQEAVYSRCGQAETIITDKYVYTEWQNEDGEAFQNMLFDRDLDRDENNNLSESAEHKSVIQELSGLLNKHIESR